MAGTLPFYNFRRVAFLPKSDASDLRSSTKSSWFVQQGLIQYVKGAISAMIGGKYGGQIPKSLKCARHEP